MRGVRVVVGIVVGALVAALCADLALGRVVTSADVLVAALEARLAAIRVSGGSLREIERLAEARSVTASYVDWSLDPPPLSLLAHADRSIVRSRTADEGVLAVSALVLDEARLCVTSAGDVAAAAVRTALDPRKAKKAQRFLDQGQKQLTRSYLATTSTRGWRKALTAQKLFEKALAKAGPHAEPTELGTFSARLDSASTTGSPLTGAHATVYLRARDDGALEVAVVAEPAWAAQLGSVTLVDAAGGSLVGTLLTAGSGLDPADPTAAGSATIPAGSATGLAASPGSFRVRVTRKGDGVELLRGTPASAGTLDGLAVLDGAELVPPVAGRRAAVTTSTSSDGSMDVLLASSAPALATLTRAALRRITPAGDVGVASVTVGAGPASDVAHAGFALGLLDLARLAHDPTAFRIVVGADAADAASGRLDAGTPGVWSAAGGLAPTDTARVGASLEFAGPGAVHVVVAAHPSLGVERVESVALTDTAASGATVLDMAAVLGQPDTTRDVATGDLVSTPLLTTRLLAAPQRFVLRAQAALPAASAVELTGAVEGVETRLFTDLGGGAVDVSVTGVRSGRAAFVMAGPTAAEVTAAALVDVTAGGAGTAVADLLGGAAVHGNSIDDETALPGDTLARMLAAPGRFAVRVDAGPATRRSGTLSFATQCTKDYAPPIEGVWRASGASASGSATLTLQTFNILGSRRDGPPTVPPSCADIAIFATVEEGPTGQETSFVEYTATGSYEGDTIEFTMESDGGTGLLDGMTFSGSFTALGRIDVAAQGASQDTSFSIDMRADEFRPVFGGIWVQEGNPDRVLRFTAGAFGSDASYVAISGGQADLVGVEVVAGVSRTFSGAFSGITVGVDFDAGGSATGTFLHANRLRWTDGSGTVVFVRAGS